MIKNMENNRDLYFLLLNKAIIQQAHDSKPAKRLADYDPYIAVVEDSPAAVYEPGDLYLCRYGRYDNCGGAVL